MPFQDFYGDTSETLTLRGTKSLLPRGQGHAPEEKGPLLGPRRPSGDQYACADCVTSGARAVDSGRDCTVVAAVSVLRISVSSLLEQRVVRQHHGRGKVTLGP